MDLAAEVTLVTGVARETPSVADIYRVEYQPMVRLAFLIAGSEEAAQEIVHDAFAELIERWDHVDNPGAYVRRAVVNRCSSRLRRLRVERKHLPMLATPSASPPPETPLFDALRRIPVRQRAAVVLRFYLDASEAEIADVLGARPGTVKSLIHRGLAALRQELEP
jgi:RNA polymerase sigma-70 factor (sigma-E family)